MGKVIGEGGQPLICTPLVARNRDAILAELELVLAKQPDVIEWRADFFADIAATDQVIDLALTLKERSETTMLFTIRSVREGGEAISLDARQAIELTAAICERTPFEYVDCELSNDPEDIAFLEKVAHRFGTKIVASYHNFTATPDPSFLLEKLLEAERRQLDVAKVAVMPQSPADVLTLLQVTLEAKKRSRLPLITMSMGGDGAVTRIVGGVFGSSLTFAVGEGSSAPGQIPIEELRSVLAVVEKAGRSTR